jgi:protein-tyrosine phosphatase
MVKSILFVCTGNICRSPTADGVLRAKLAASGIDAYVDSCGTHAYHVGEAPDPRSIKHAESRGYDLSTLVARKIDVADFDEFDVILCLDKTHYENVAAMRPKTAKAEVHLYLEYAGVGPNCVPDPYYGNYRDFEYVLDLVEDASDAIIKKLSS